MEINSPEMMNVINLALDAIKDDSLSFYISRATVEDAYKGDLVAMNMVSDLLLYIGKCEESYVWKKALKEKMA